MNYSLCLQSTYDHVAIALCNNQTSIESICVPNQKSSATLIPHINTLLTKHNLTLTDCNYIAVNQGPGPFTTLRTVLATVNGIALATNIPLIGIDGLKGFVACNRSCQHPYTIALLNAFNNEIYYAIASEKECITGYASAATVHTLIKEAIGKSAALVIGNGIKILENNPDFIVNDASLIVDSTREHCSIADIAKLGFASWSSNQATQAPLMPLYLKKHAVERV